MNWEERMTDFADSRAQITSTTLLEFIGDSVRASSYQVDVQLHESMLPWIFNYTLQRYTLLPSIEAFPYTKKYTVPVIYK